MNAHLSDPVEEIADIPPYMSEERVRTFGLTDDKTS